MTIRVSGLALTLGGLLLVVGLFLGFGPSGAKPAPGLLADCGSVFVHTPSQSCDEARNGRTTLTWALLIPGLILLGVGAVARINERDKAADAVKAERSKP